MALALVRPENEKAGKLGLDHIPQEQIRELNDFVHKFQNMLLFRPDGNPKEEWRIFYARTWADAEDTALLTAGEVAKDMSVKAEWRMPKNTELIIAQPKTMPHTARNAAWRAANNAILLAARAAGREDAVLEARHARIGSGRRYGLDAALMAGLILVKDLDFEGKDKYLRHAAKRMEVWEKGYGCEGDVNGVLYVYAQTGSEPERYLRSPKSNP